MKKQILTAILVSAILMPTLNFLKINPFEIEPVKAEPGAPYTIIKNPYLNDTNYWIPEVLRNPDIPPSQVTVDSFGTTIYVQKHCNTIEHLIEPWGLGELFQGYRFHSGENYDVGKGLQYYIYIPADIPDGTIMVNFTVTRMMNPDGPFAPGISFPPFVMASGPCTHFGVGFWYAVKVKFWDDPRVPTQLRNKETYLGWMSPQEWGAPNLFVQEFFCDYRVFDYINGTWNVYSREKGTENPLVAFPAFLGSTQDWDWHSNLPLNDTDLSVTETFTYDIGKGLKEFLNIFNQRPYITSLGLPNDLTKLTSYGWHFGFFRPGADSPIVPNAAMGTIMQQLYDIEGFTLIAAAPTLEVVNSAMKAKFSWFQIYDYRQTLTTDPLFQETINLWLWMKSKGFADPFQENYENAVLPQDTLIYRHSILGEHWEPASSTPILQDSAILAENEKYLLNLSVVSDLAHPWGRAGINYTFLNLPSEALSLTVNIIFGVQYLGGHSNFNSGFYLDYCFSIDGVPSSAGEVVLHDWYSYRGTWSNCTFYNVTITFTKPAGNSAALWIMPHVETWWTASLHIRGYMDVGIIYTKQETVNYTINITVNNQSYGSVSPSPGTYTYPSGTNVTLSATANSGYYFDHWNVRNDLKGINVNYTMNPLNLTVNIDYNVTAYFASSSPPPPATYTLQLSTFIYPLSGIRLETLVPPTLLHNESSNWISGTGIWSYAIGSIINLGITNDQGWYFYYWVDGTNHVTQKNWTTTLNSDKSWTAIFLPPYQCITVKDANSGVELSGFTVYYGSSSWYVDGSGCYIVGNYKTYGLIITKEGYYDTAVDIKLERGSTVIYLTPIQYSGGGGGGGRPPLMMSKLFSYTLTILNATQNVYRTWDNLLEVYPIYGTKATLTLTVHYNSTHPVIEIEAENIAMIKWNFTDIYHKVGCVYFDRVPTLTKFYGLRIESNSSLILDFELPAKPGELWKLLPQQELPGTKLTDWKWRDGRVLLLFEPGDPTVSILLQTAMQQTQDVVFQFMMIMVTLVMVLAAFKFIKDKF
jgi:hypothetical protein